VPEKKQNNNGKDIEKTQLFKRAEELLQTFKKGAEFTQELLKENERLRYKIIQVEEENKNLKKMGGEDRIEILEKRIREIEKEKEELISRYKQVEKENIDFAKKYVEVEEENNNLANLYIASYQLHSTLDFKEVLQIIIEIIINLVGAEVFAIFLHDPKLKSLLPVAAEGLNVKDIPYVKIGDGVIGRVAEKGENYFKEKIDPQRKLNLEDPLVVIPLKVRNELIGLISIYRLLQQKKEFQEVDFELFTLLAGHAATAIFSSKLYSDSQRKLSTIQGFIELLTK